EHAGDALHLGHGVGRRAPRLRSPARRLRVALAPRDRRRHRRRLRLPGREPEPVPRPPRRGDPAAAQRRGPRLAADATHDARGGSALVHELERLRVAPRRRARHARAGHARRSRRALRRRVRVRRGAHSAHHARAHSRRRGRRLSLIAVVSASRSGGGAGEGSRLPRGTRALLLGGWAPSRRTLSDAAWRERVPRPLPGPPPDRASARARRPHPSARGQRMTPSKARRWSLRSQRHVGCFAPSWRMMIPASVRTMPAKARRVMRSSRKMTASGIVNIGAVDERTEATATPACLTPATNMTELTEVIAPRTRIWIFTARSLRAKAPGTERAQGVIHSTIEATGRRIACAVVALISASGGLTRTVETAHASEASAAAPTPDQKRPSGARSAHGATITTRPAIVTSEPTAIGTVTGSFKKAAAITAAPSG